MTNEPPASHCSPSPVLMGGGGLFSRGKNRWRSGNLGWPTAVPVVPRTVWVKNLHTSPPRPELFMGEPVPAVTNSPKLTVPPGEDSASGPRERQLPWASGGGGHFDLLSKGVRVGDPAKLPTSVFWPGEGEADPGIPRKVEEGTHLTGVCNCREICCRHPRPPALLYLVMCSSSAGLCR